jgi:purine-nucleoside phosphorylase
MEPTRNDKAAYAARIRGAAEAIEKVCGGAEIGVILGSGLGDYAEALDGARKLPYAQIPGFPVSTVPGHAGEWCAGALHGKRVAMMRGRFHYYEGYALRDVTLPVRVMQRLGVRTLIVTNAAGGVNTGFVPGDLMAISDCINMTAANPLFGPNLDDFGPRFPDMSRVFDAALRALAHRCAEQRGLTLRDGVYAQMTGPSFETPAEIRMLRALGADAVGMSTVPEVIVARHGGLRVLGVSCITNMAAGILDQPLNHEEVMQTGERVKHTFRMLLDDVIAAL